MLRGLRGGATRRLLERKLKKKQKLANQKSVRGQKLTQGLVKRSA